MEQDDPLRARPHAREDRDLILEHVDELAQLESLDNGKPYPVAQAADVPLSADLFHSEVKAVTAQL